MLKSFKTKVPYFFHIWKNKTGRDLYERHILFIIKKSSYTLVVYWKISITGSFMYAY